MLSLPFSRWLGLVALVFLAAAIVTSVRCRYVDDGDASLHIVVR